MNREPDPNDTRARIKVLTVIFRASMAEVRRLAATHARGAKCYSVGRFVALQHPDLERYGEQGLWDIAHARGLPVERILYADPIMRDGERPVPIDPDRLAV